MSELEGIAIVGIAARYPGARGAGELWRNLRDGIETVTFFTAEELAAAGVDPALLADPRYVRAKGALEDADLFDAAFFGFTPREAEAMDPQHRVFLECAWEALEDAACDPERSSGRIGVWAGSGISSYLISNLLPAQERLASFGGLQVLLLNDRDFLATRASYELDLKGPSVAVQSACSTSLVAVHMACQSLLGGECDLALAGGVSISVPLRTGYLYQEGSVMSPDGCCRAFDASAGGAVEGNGCGVVALKRLADAVADGDRVYAVIRGSAVNNDGADKVGFTAPSVEGQAEVISEALMMAGVEPETIGYVEAHGSGTPLGDPIEVAALTQAFRAAGAEEESFCAIGSIKTNFGHCNTAAGVAGLIKTSLAIRHAILPPSLHFESPNPQIAFAGSPFYVCNEARPWQRDGFPRRAGVSSFGLGGTNAHVVLEEAPAPEPGDEPSRPAQLLVLSARTPSALDAAAARLSEHLEAYPDLSLADVAWTLQVGRKAFEHRQIKVGGDWIRGRREEGPAVVFLFPGLGDQHVDMARELYEAEPVFREQVDLCAARLSFDLLSVIFPSGPRAERKAADPFSRLRRSSETTPLDETVHAQPACFVIEHALGRLLMSWGIEPQAMIGYSVGEYVAACLSGALSLDDALELVERRAKLIQDLPGGAMLAVPLPEEEVRPRLSGSLSLSATNGPHFSVVGGPAEEVEALERGLGVSCIRLRTTHAFHSAMMEPAVAPFTEIARKVRMQAPRIPFVSNVTGTWITADDLADPAYWARHMRSPVRFAEGVGELLQEPDRIFLEVGPGATLGTLVKQHPDAEANRITIPTLREGADLEAVLEAVGRLWIAGVEIDWLRFHNGERRRRVPLPTYPFERQRYWLDPPKTTAPRIADVEDWFWVPAWKQVPLKAAAPEPGRWLIFLDGQGVGERIADRLRRDGHEVFTVARGQDYDLHESLPDRILHLWDEEEGLISLVRLAQGLSAIDKPVRLVLVCSGLHELVDGDPVHPGKAAVLGALKVVHQELPRVTCSSVDAAPGPGLEERLIAEVSAADPVVALRGRQRWVRGFERVRLEETASLEGTWLIAEAAHGPGMAIADHLIRDGARQGASVALVLPPQLPDRSQWETWKGLPDVPPGQDVIGAAILRLLALEKETGLDRVRIFHDLFSALAAGPFRGAFFTGVPHGAGLIQLKTPDGVRAALDPVVRGAEDLLAALEPSVLVLLCSTTTAVTGSLGLFDLAAAGSFLEALAVRHASGGRPVTAVHWDPYQWGGWLVTGVAGGMAGLSNDEVRANLDAHGVTEAKSARALRRLLGSPYPRLIVSAQDLPGLIAETDSVTAESLLAQMSHGGEKAARPGLSTAYEPPQGELEERLAAIWQDLFGIEPIGRGDNFLELGGHSLLAIQVTTQVQTALQADLPVTALFEAPTIAELAKAVRRARGEDDPEEMEALLAMIEGLSPEEAAAKLAELEA
jgi:acyl transferase domain-containing protein/acyl carrier protein